MPQEPSQNKYDPLGLMGGSYDPLGIMAVEEPAVEESPDINVGRSIVEGAKDAFRNLSNFIKSADEAKWRAVYGGNEEAAKKRHEQEREKDWLMQQADEKWLAPDGTLKRPEGFKGYVQDMAKMVAPLSAQIATSVAGGPVAGGMLMGMQIAGQTKEELDKEGVDPERAWKAALGNAFAQAPLEQIGVGKALKFWKPGKKAASAIKRAVESGGTEFLTEWAQKYPELMATVWAKGEGKTSSEMLDDFTEGFAQATKEGIYEGAVAAPFGAVLGGAAIKADTKKEEAPQKNGIEKFREDFLSGSITEEQAQTLYDQASGDIKDQIGEIISSKKPKAQEPLPEEPGLFPKQTEEEQAAMQRDIEQQRGMAQDRVYQAQQQRQFQMEQEEQKEAALAKEAEEAQKQELRRKEQESVERVESGVEKEIERNAAARAEIAEDLARKKGGKEPPEKEAPTDVAEYDPIGIMKDLEETKASTLRGRIKKAGGINFGNFKGELKDLPVGVKFLAKKSGTPIDLIEKDLKSEGWLDKSEDLLSLLRDPEVLKRGQLGEEAITAHQKKQKEKQRWEAKPEEPPSGEYEYTKAQDLPEGKTLTIIDGNSVDGWDTYTVVDKDPFGVKLKDGKTIELSPLDEVQVLKDIGPEKPAKYSTQTEGTKGITPAEVKTYFDNKGIESKVSRDVVTVKTHASEIKIKLADTIVKDDAVTIRAAYGREPAPGEKIAGAYFDGEIELRRDLADLQTLDHELFHHMKAAKLFNPQEERLLSKHGDEEAQARWIEEKLRDRANTKGVVRKMVSKVRDFLDAIVNAFGLKTERGVVRGVESGKPLKRKPAAPKKSPAKLSTKDDDLFESYFGEKGDKPKKQPKKQSKKQPKDIFESDDGGFVGDLMDRMVFQLQDRFTFLKKEQRRVEREKGEELSEDQDAYLAELRYHGMAGAAVEDFQTDHVDPILDIIGDNNFTIKEVDDFLHARHAEEANAQLKKINPEKENNEALSGMSDKQAKEILGEYADNEGMQEIGKRIDAITKATRKLLASSGLEKAETVEAWEKAYKKYVPLKRGGFGSKLPVKGRGFDVRGKSKRRAGSLREVENVLANLIAGHEATIIRAEKNKVSKALLNFARNNEGPWEVDKVDYKPTFTKDGLVVYRPDPFSKMADNVLAIKEKGEEHYVTFDEQDLSAMRIVAAMKNLNSADSGPIVNILSKFTRYLAAVNTGLNPEFVISNFIRDIQTAGYNMSDSEANGIKFRSIRQVGKAWKGIRSFQKGKKSTEWAKAYDKFRKAGAKTGWMEAYSDIKNREKALEKKVKRAEKKGLNTIKNAINSTFDFIEDHNTAVENAIRLSTFKNLLEAGVSEAKAAKIAKEMTVNFNRKGNAGQALNALYLFYNASIQGSARILLALSKSPKVRRLATATVAFAAMLDMANRVLGGDDDDGQPRYDKVPDWVKERNLIVMLTGGQYIKIPLPWGYNVLHVMGQAIGESLTRGKPSYLKSALRVAGATVGAFNPVGGTASLLQVISPTITDPIVQWAENKDWAGKKLRPDNNPFAEKPSSQLFWGSVREPSKSVAAKINELTGGDEVRPGGVDISPEAIDLAIDTFTGGAGRFVGNMISAPIKLAKKEEIESHEVPFLRKVYGRPGLSQVTGDFYENMDSVNIVKRQIRHYRSDRRKLNEIKKKYSKERRLIHTHDFTKKRIRRLKDSLKRAENIKSKPARTKKEDRIKKKIEDEMRRFNKRYNKAMEEK